MNNNDVYEMVTDQIIKQLEAGTVPWRKPWRSGAGVGPTNLVSNKAYRGINVFLLNVAAYEAGYSSPYWLTMRQAKELGGHLKYLPEYAGHTEDWTDSEGVTHKPYETGQHSTVVIFWQMIKPRQIDPDDPNKKIPMLRYYRVFNLDQFEDIKVPKGRVADETEPEEQEFDAIAAAEAIIAGYMDPPKIVEREPRAYYRASADLVNLPPRELFESAEEFYATAFHELGHSTGHKDRLDRLTPTYFGSHDYGREELVAEMTAAFLTAEAGIESVRENNAAYLASWIETLREDTKAVVTAAGKAQKAADLILGRKYTESGD